MKKIEDVAKTNVFSSPFISSPAASSSFNSKRELAFAATADSGSSGGSSVVYGSTEYYLKCAFGGALSCGPTHTSVVPLDLVKCRIQVDPGKYLSLIHI